MRLFSRTPDYESLAVELLERASEYQEPSIDGIRAYLKKSQQSRNAPEIEDRKLLNLLSAWTSAELFLLDISSADQKRTELLNSFYLHSSRLLKSWNAIEGDVQAPRRTVSNGIDNALRKYPSRGAPAGDRVECFQYELVRVVTKTYFELTPTAEGRLPSADADWKELSLAASGLARAHRWLDSSLSAKFQRKLSA